MSGENVYLCQLDEIQDPGSRGFKFPEIGNSSLFVVKKNGRLGAFRNSCPHTGAPMEWKPNQFLDFENEYIQCALHGALFDLQSGECLRGPCLGKFLTSEKLVIEGPAVFWESKAL